ncbi:MAG: beta-galactosidase [Firmicutes bacterium]|nr:beta-galactosidase [Bacillota bacterium]
MLHKHPEIVATDETVHLQGGCGRHCYNSIAFIRYVKRLVEEMAGHYASNPAVIGWQIDNEVRGVKCNCEQCNGLIVKLPV